MRTGHASLWLAMLGTAALAGCKDTFRDSELAATVRPAPALPIPDTMTRTQATEAGVVVESASGDLVADASLTWESSDNRVVQVNPTEEGNRALLTATGLGAAEISVRITGGIGAVPQTILRDSVRVLERWLSVALGRGSGCAINVDSVAYCWGFPLGDGTNEGSQAPVKVRGVLDFPAIHLELGDATNCMTVFRGGVVYCWGLNSAGEMGNGNTAQSLVATESLLGSPFDLLSLSAGGAYFCGVFFDPVDQDLGEFASCWGLSFLGQLGAPAPSTTTCTFNFRTYPCALGLAAEIFNVDTLSAGETHACVVKGFDFSNGAGVVHCWGAAAMGQAGPGDPSRPIGFCPAEPDESRDPAGIPCLSQPAPVDHDLHFVSVSAGWDVFIGSSPTPDIDEPSWLAESHTCGISTSGTAYCWGKNDLGQLGAPSDSMCQRAFMPGFGSDIPQEPAPCRSHPAPVLPAAVATFRALSVGSEHTCGIGSDDLVYCWGSNEFGQLGDGTGGSGGIDIHRLAPAPIASDRSFGSLDSGPVATCGVTDDGSIYCWGSGYGTSPTRLPEPR